MLLVAFLLFEVHKMKSKKDERVAQDFQQLSINEVDYDSDEEPPKAQEKGRLSWRMDPSKSHSDWTIEVIRGSSTGVYHVHKNILAVGPRKSGYFTKLFQDGGRFAESRSSTSHIELNELAANAFPDVLDYAYSVDGPLTVTTENATALYSLGQYLDMRSLRWEAKQFWKKDLTIDTCAIYYEHASLFQDEKILNTVIEVATENVMKLNPASPLVKMEYPSFWIRLMESLTITDFVSFHLSNLVAELCKNIDIEPSIFEQLTSEENLPIIRFDAALTLLDMERTVYCPDAGSLTSLQKRCIDAIAQNWHNLGTPRETISSVLDKQNPRLLTELLLLSVTWAQKDKSDLANKLFSSRKEAAELRTALVVSESLLSNTRKCSKPKGR